MTKQIVKPHEIVKRNHPVLRKQADEVPVDEIKSKKIQQHIADMKVALAEQEDGAALAAPQIGISLRIFVIAERLFGDHPESEYRSKDPHFVFINPILTKLSKRKTLMDEGCLSVRGEYGTVPRHSHATIKAYDEHGKLFTRGASGLLAQVFQHETDHLDGILFVDKAKELWKEKPSEDRQQRAAS
jgi:peptide deformylase